MLVRNGSTEAVPATAAAQSGSVSFAGTKPNRNSIGCCSPGPSESWYTNAARLATMSAPVMSGGRSAGLASRSGIIGRAA